MPKVHLGTSGWYYEHWRGIFYPEDLPKGEWLLHYLKYFNTVEINASFYRFPFPNMLKAWVKKTPEGFIFAVKANRRITHEQPIAREDLLRAFYDRIALLGDRKGPILFQLPPSLKKDIGLLEEFLGKLDPDEENVVEFRHPTWFDKDTYKVLSDYKVRYCIVSAPGIPMDVEVTAEFAYIRWHGTVNWYASEYSMAELRYWADIIKDIAKEYKVYGYFNNDFYGYAVKNCMELKELLREAGIDVS